METAEVKAKVLRLKELLRDIRSDLEDFESELFDLPGMLDELRDDQEKELSNAHEEGYNEGYSVAEQEHSS